MHILLVEDTHAIGKNVREYLELCGHTVMWCEDLATAEHALANHRYECAVLDWMLPDGDGAQLCQHIKMTKPMPVIMMTAKSQIDDKVQAYNSGADDYITKPFDLKELELRINAITKRAALDETAPLHIKDLVIDLEQHTVYRNSEKVSLSHTEFLILQLLIDHKGQVVSRTDILDEVRGEESMRGNDNKLDVYMYSLRKKLGKDTITTVKGVGYQIAL